MIFYLFLYDIQNIAPECSPFRRNTEFLINNDFKSSKNLTKVKLMNLNLAIVKLTCCVFRILNENFKLWEIRQKNQIDTGRPQKIWQVPNKPLVQD